ncbi:MAG: hypothetical protein LC104_22060 [Bacteroidales bacterium]|nr:hypothetical protein [Bacteroidales bacterium]
MIRLLGVLSLALVCTGCEPLGHPPQEANAPATPQPQLLAGTAKVDITRDPTIPPSDRMYARVLVLQQGDTQVALIGLDVVAIGGIGPIDNGYLGRVRKRLQAELGIRPESVLINASHCHGVVAADVDARTVQAVGQAVKNLVPVKVGTGTGYEDRIMQNRRMTLKNQKQADVRHAYSIPSDDDVVSVGPIDPKIGILRIDRMDNTTLAVVYQFACHPIMGTPTTAGNTADLTGYASRVIEENLGHGAVAVFLQGCGGDINPIGYKDVHHPRHAEPLGNQLGLSTLQAVRKISPRAAPTLTCIQEQMQLPRGDTTERLIALEAEQSRLLKSLRGTTLDYKSFQSLVWKYGLFPEYPSEAAHRYLHEKQWGRTDWNKLDAENRRNMQNYLANIRTMEELTRIQTNLALLRKHNEAALAAGRQPIPVELVGLRVGDFRLVTFPGELTVQIGLNIQSTFQKPNTFVSGYTNGYIYYAPTSDQLKNRGYAQEDCDCILAPEWQPLFEKKAVEIFQKL